MTDGILLNEMTSDPLINEYSVIIIDEAHERKINTDLLIGLLSKVVNVRAKKSKEEREKNPKQIKYCNSPLRLVIMSATLRVEDFTSNKFLFPKKINVINVESRQFPVSIYFNKITPDNYMEEALKKCKKIHKKLPFGDVLVFLTGEKEIKEFCYKLEIELSREEEFEDEYSNIDLNKNLPQKKLKHHKEKKTIYDPDSDEEILEINPEPANKTVIQHINLTNKEIPSKFLIFPLFSKLSLAEQERIFKSHNENTRFFNYENIEKIIN